MSLFVFFAARGELESTRMRSAFRGLSVREAMLTDYETLDASDTLEAAAARLLAGSQQDFPVVRDGVFAGILTRQDLLRGLASHGVSASVGKAATNGQPMVDPGDMLDAVLPQLGAGSSLAVVRDGRLHGLLTVDNVLEMRMIREATQERAVA